MTIIHTAGARADHAPQPPRMRRRTRPIQFVALLDGSISATSWNRHARASRPSVLNDWHSEVRLALQHVARRCYWAGYEPAEVPLVAVVHFDPGGSRDLEPTPLSPATVGRLDSTIAVPLGGTGSSLGYALTVAEHHAARRRDHLTIVAVYSDFELSDIDLPGVLERLAAFPGRAHAIALGNEAPVWLVADRRVSVVEIPWNSRPGTVAQATLAAMSSAVL